MLSFKTISYLEGIWNAICWVEYKTRRWDVYNLDLFIIEQIANGVPIILEDMSDENERYKDLVRLGQISKELTIYVEENRESLNKPCSISDWNKLYKEFLELLPKTFTHLWY